MRSERDPRPQRGGASPHAAAEEPTTGRCLEVSPRVKLALISQKIELAEAIRYALSRWQDLTRFIDDGRIELDNNIVERATRGIKLGRKNACLPDPTVVSNTGLSPHPWSRPAGSTTSIRSAISRRPDQDRQRASKPRRRPATALAYRAQACKAVA